MIYELFLFSINGNPISRERLNYPVQDMIVKSEHCILALLINSRSSTAAVNSSMNSSRMTESGDSPSSSLSAKLMTSKLVFKEIFELESF